MSKVSPFPITVAIPCYNESRRLEPLFELIRANIDLGWEWLFVNDGSRDDTAAKIEAFCQLDPSRVRLHSLPENQGKGEAVRQAILEAQGRLIGFIDADLAASPLEFKRFLEHEDVVHGESFLIGIRLKTQEDRVKRHFHRHLMGRVFQTYTSIVTGLTVYDTQCGFKLIARDQGQAIAEQMACKGFAFDVEMILLALARGMRIREEMINWEEQGDSRVRPQHIIQMVIDIWKIKRRVARGS